MNDKPTLLPCPFCGSTKIDPHGWVASDGRHGPACDDCGGSADSALRWNTRYVVNTSGKPLLPGRIIPVGDALRGSLAKNIEEPPCSPDANS